MLPRAEDCAGALVGSPHARRLGAGVLLGASLCRLIRLDGWSQVGGPFDDESGGLVGWVGGFVLPPSYGSSPMILVVLGMSAAGA
jgi:hypothetical protein